MSDAQLKQAYQLIKAGKKREAVKVLAPIVNTDRSNADAWWLLANSLDKPDKVQRALKNALKHRPDHAQARAMLEQMGGSSPTLPKSEPKEASGRIDPVTVGIVVVGGVLVVAVVALLVMLVSRGGSGGGVDCPENVAPPLEAIEATETVFFGLNFKGCIEAGQPIRDSVDTFEDDGWAFHGEAGQEFVIDAVSRSSLDPALYFFDPRGRLIAENDDIDFMNDNTNARLYVKLPNDGTYTVVVHAFGDGGAYELIME